MKNIAPPQSTSHRTRILESLETCLDAKSFRDITLTDIAAAAHISRRTFYEHFANKDEQNRFNAQTGDCQEHKHITVLKTWPLMCGLKPQSCSPSSSMHRNAGKTTSKGVTACFCCLGDLGVRLWPFCPCRHRRQCR